jgi:hypothetical protein
MKARFALSLLAVTSIAAAQALSGAAAQGTATFATARGAVTGPISVAVAAGGYCKLTLTLGGEDATAVAHGAHASVHGEARWVRALPLPLDPRLGCPLLPRPGAASSLAWRFRGQPALIAYNGQTVTISVAGATRLTIVYGAVTSATFTPDQFPLPPAPKNFPQRKLGGGQ